MNKKEKVMVIIAVTILMTLASLLTITINSLYDKYVDAYPEKVIRAELVGEVYHNGHMLLIYERVDGAILTINRNNEFDLTKEDVEIELIYRKTGNILYYVRKALEPNPSNNIFNNFKTIGTVNYKFVGINKITLDNR